MDFASLGIRVDTSGVKESSKDLEQLASTSARAEAAARDLGPSHRVAAQEISRSASAAKAATNSYAAQARHVQGATISARQYSAALRLVPAQLTDIVTQLAGGQSPFLIAIQQGGQLRDSFGGFGNTLRALRSVLTPTRLAIGGVAGVAGILAKSVFDAQRETFEFHKALALSGNAAGVTADQLREMARAVDDFVGTEASAAAAIAKLASTGRVAGKDLKEFATIAQQFERAVGQPIDETVKAFAELGRRPVESILKLNESMNFLTVETYKSIRALEQQGDVLGAREAAQRAFADALADVSTRTEANLGALQRIGRGAVEVFKELKSALLAIGRDGTIDEQVKNLRAQFAAVQQQVAQAEAIGGNPIDQRRRLIEIHDQIEALFDLKKANKDAAASGKERNDALQTELKSEQALTNAIQTRAALLQARSTSDIAAINRRLSASLAGFSAYESMLDALFNAGGARDEKYFAAKRELIERTTRLQGDALREESARLQRDIAELTKQLDIAGKDVRGDVLPETERLKAQLPLQTKINELEERRRDIAAQLAELFVELGERLGLLNIQHQKSVDLSEKLLANAREESRIRLETITRQRTREIDSIGRGPTQRDRDAGVAQIEDRFLDERRSLEGSLRSGDIDQGQFDDLLAVAEEFRQKDLAGYETYFNEILEKQGSFVVGMQEGIARFRDESRKVAESTADVFKNAFDGIADELTRFVTQGKVDFKSLANSIIADLLRIKIRKALGDLFGDGEGGFSLESIIKGIGGIFGGKRAEGGDVSPGRAYLVGERGPELLVPRQAASIIPSNMLRRAPDNRPTVVINSVVNAAAGTSVAQVDAIVKQRNAELELRLFDNMYRGRWQID